MSIIPPQIVVALEELFVLEELVPVEPALVSPFLTTRTPAVPLIRLSLPGTLAVRARALFPDLGPMCRGGSRSAHTRALRGPFAFANLAWFLLPMGFRVGIEIPCLIKT